MDSALEHNNESPVFAALEFSGIMLLAWLAFIAIPLSLGEIGLSWDALNHQIYLGWTAEHPRFDKDLLAASTQSYQYPYLYWPVYRLATGGASGVFAGVVLATLHLVVVPPVWMIARTCMPGQTWFDGCMRLLALVLAFMTGVVLVQFDSTSNDLMASAPLVWAIALAVSPLRQRSEVRSRGRRAALLSGFLAGMSVAFKLSNGPLAIILPALWLLPSGALRTRLFNTSVACLAAAIGFSACYGFWGWQLWSYYGNPIYPFYDSLFIPVRAAVGWQP